MSNPNQNEYQVHQPTSPSKSRVDKLQPHYFQTFQKHCCDLFSDGSSFNILPIPVSFKNQVIEIDNYLNQFLIENILYLNQYTAMIPDTFFIKDDHNQINRFLIDWSLYNKMTNNFVINWVPYLNKLYPIRTSGNGNCLLHAVLIATIGIHDQNLNLRDVLIHFIEQNQQLLKGFWQQSRIESDKRHGIDSDQERLDRDWVDVCAIVSYDHSTEASTKQLRFLESIHVFSISNLLRRPIIILSDSYVRGIYDEIISYNDLYGIYLPILNSPFECRREPIVLIYDQYHFSPLQTRCVDTKDSYSRNLLPLYPTVTAIAENTFLPVRFSYYNDDSTQTLNSLGEYLKLEEVEFRPDEYSAPMNLICARLGCINLDAKVNLLPVFAHYCQDFFEIQLPIEVEKEFQSATRIEIPVLPLKRKVHRSIITHNINPSEIIDVEAEEDNELNENNSSRKDSSKLTNSNLTAQDIAFGSQLQDTNIEALDMLEDCTKRFPRERTDTESPKYKSSMNVSLDFRYKSAPPRYTSIPIDYEQSTNSSSKTYTPIDYQTSKVDQNDARCIQRTQELTNVELCEKNKPVLEIPDENLRLRDGSPFDSQSYSESDKSEDDVSVKTSSNMILVCDYCGEDNRLIPGQGLSEHDCHSCKNPLHIFTG